MTTYKKWPTPHEVHKTVVKGGLYILVCTTTFCNGFV